MRPMLMALVVSLSALGVAGARAGGCVERPEVDVADFGRGPGTAEFQYALWCLTDACRIGTDIWAAPNAAARFAAQRVDTLRTRIRGAMTAPLASSWADAGDHVDMAILQDCRAVGLLRPRYDELRAHPEVGYPDEIVDLLSCLYHLPCEAATTMATDLVAGETEARLLDRLRKVLESRR